MKQPTKTLTLTLAIRDNIIQATKVDARNCASVCKDYIIMYNAYEPLMWFMRYTKVAWESGFARQFYRWLCFDKDGKQVDCDPIFGSVEKENIFKEAMFELEQIENVFV